MIKYIFSVLFLLIAEFSFAQQELLANNLYEKGEFEKAQLAYEDLNKSQPNNPLVFSRLIDCYQQLKKFNEAEKLLRVKIDKQKQYPFLVDLGYNYQLQPILMILMYMKRR
jgi:tetratricopeptide (TPR) repeat protein